MTTWVNNPAPNAPGDSDWSLNGWGRNLEVVISSSGIPSDNDLEGMLVLCGTSSGLTYPDDLCYEGNFESTTFKTNAVAGTTYYIQIAAFDKFGKSSLNWSSEKTVVPSYVLEADIGTDEVANNHLQTDSVATAQIQSLAVTNEEINDVSVGKLTAGAIAAGQKIYVGTGTYGNANTGFYVDADGYMSLKDKFTWNPNTNTLTIVGTIDATAGEIGGWSIEANSLSNGNMSIHSSTGINFNNVFTVDQGGVLTATAGEIGGWSINASTIDSGSNEVILDSSNKKITINNTAFGNTGIQLDYNSGTPRAYIGDGTNAYFQFDGTKVTWKGVNTELDASGNLIASSVDLSGEIKATSGFIGGTTSGWSISSDQISNGNMSINSTTGINFNSVFTVDQDGALTSTSGTIAGWDIQSTLLRSSTSGARIELNKDKNRVSIFDAVNEKTAMGYLEGLAKNNGTKVGTTSYTSTTMTDAGRTSSAENDWESNELAGLEILISGQSNPVTIVSNTSNVITVVSWPEGTPTSNTSYTVQFPSNVYGFWALPGDKVRIDGDVGYEGGDWLVSNDASVKILDGSGNEIIRLGTDTGDKGLFIYNTSGTQLAKYVSDEIYIGEAGNYLQYSGGTLSVTGQLTVGATTLTENNFLDGSATNSDVGLGNVENYNAQNQAQNGLTSGTTITGGGITLNGGGIIKSFGKDSISDTTSGFFLGHDGASSYDFAIGNATKYLKWDGSAGTMTIRGSLNADDITAGTLTGRTIQTSSSGKRIVLSSSSNEVECYNSSGTKVASLGQLTVGSDPVILEAGNSSDDTLTAILRNNSATKPTLKITNSSIDANKLALTVIGDQTLTGKLYVSDNISTSNSSKTWYIPDNLFFVGDQDTGIVRTAANELDIKVGNATRVEVKSSEINLSAPLDCTSGSASAPAIFCSNDSDTGFYYVSSNNLGVSCGGNQVATFNENQGLNLVNYPVFRASYGTTRINMATGTWYTMDFDADENQDFNHEADFNDATSTFTAPSAGIYRLHAQIRLNGLTSLVTTAILSIVTTSYEYRSQIGVADSDHQSISVDCLAEMAANDTAVVKVYISGSSSVDVTAVSGRHYGRFEGFRIY